MSDYRPGTVATITDPVYGQRTAIFVRTGQCWHSVHDNGDLRCTAAESVVNVRPVVVIDPEDRDQVKALTDTFMHNLRLREMPDRPAMYAALRSLIAPPKPPEPQGLGAVVEDAEGRKWVRGPSSNAPTEHRTDWCDSEGEFVQYGAISAVRVLHEGWSE